MLWKQLNHVAGTSDAMVTAAITSFLAFLPPSSAGEAASGGVAGGAAGDAGKLLDAAAVTIAVGASLMTLVAAMALV